MTHSLAVLLFIVAQNKSNSLDTGEVNTLSSSHTSWVILDQSTLIHHDSALILDWLNWFTIQRGSNASDQSRVMREAELICTSAKGDIAWVTQALHHPVCDFPGEKLPCSH